MAADLAITLEGREQVEKLLRAIDKKIKNLQPALNLIGEIVRNSIDRNFESEGRPTRWPPLSPARIEQRSKGEGAHGTVSWPGKILAVRGREGGLMGTISYQADDQAVVISANKAYAPVHQFGAKKGELFKGPVRIREHLRRLPGGGLTTVRGHTRQAEAPWGDIPPRPFLMVQEDDWDEIRLTLSKYLLRATGGIA